ncbi:MAG: hypothetical protein L0Y71_03895 [Gemmataceae bacterium]|nr:hypothetical protein [Gemmataceae bacterium]
MGQFFRPRGNDRLWLYSERGLLSYLFHTLLDKNLEPVLEHAKNGNGRKLRDVPGMNGLHRVMTEFSLGSDGFGNPDGAIWGLDQAQTSFVFVEGKPSTFANSFRPRRTLDAVHNKLAEPDGKRAARKLIRGYLSTLNGQLELKWRFINALRASLGKREINERHVTLDPETAANDVLYWRHSFCPDPTKRKQWRRVRLDHDLAVLRRALETVREFYLLAITPDSEYPREQMNQVRLFDAAGQPLGDAADRLYWMSLNRVKEHLERCFPDGCWKRLENGSWVPCV